MNASKRNLILWMLIGIAGCGLLIPTITEARGMQMLLNIGAFLGLYTGGFLFVVALRWVQHKRQTAPDFDLLRASYNASRIMVFAVLMFGLYWYDFSTPRTHSWFDSYKYIYTPPTQIQDSIETSSLQDVGINQSQIKQMVELFVNNEDYKWQHSFLLAIDNKLIVEEYFYDEGRDITHDLRSANKSMTSILVGIAIEQGFIPSVNTPVYQYFPEHHPLFEQSPKKKRITIEHLLTMSAGLDANDWNPSSLGNENKLYRMNEDWIGFIFQLPLLHEPGEQYQYSTAGEMLLRSLLVRVTSQSYADFAQKNLFAPLGITNYRWTQYFNDDQAVPIRVELTSRDMLKLGILMTNDGLWQGKQIMPKNWITASTRPRLFTKNRNFKDSQYGYLWWNIKFDVDGKPVRAFQAMGAGGQMILAFPDINAQLVFTSGNYGRSRQVNPIHMVNDILLPALCQSRNCFR